MSAPKKTPDRVDEAHAQQLCSEIHDAFSEESVNDLEALAGRCTDAAAVYVARKFNLDRRSAEADMDEAIGVRTFKLPRKMVQKLRSDPVFVSLMAMAAHLDDAIGRLPDINFKGYASNTLHNYHYAHHDPEACFDYLFPSLAKESEGEGRDF